jgi:hypothetical protein
MNPSTLAYCRAAVPLDYSTGVHQFLLAQRGITAKYHATFTALLKK